MQNNKLLVVIIIILGAVLFLETAYLISLERSQIRYNLNSRIYQPMQMNRIQDDYDPIFWRRLQQDHLRQMEQMQQNFNHLLENSSILPKRMPDFPYTFTMQDNGQVYVLHMFVPGLSKQEVVLELEGRNLKISGAKRYDKNIKKNGYASEEYRVGSFVQVITLPEDALAKEITSEYKNQVLTVNIPKKKESKTPNTKIPIK